MVVSGMDGYDELSLCAPTKITELNDGWIRSYTFTPEEVGLNYLDHSNLIGGDAEVNKQIALSVLSGEDSHKAELVGINAGAALYLYGKADSIRDGYHMAREIMKSGKGIKTIETFARLSNEKDS